MLEDAQPGLDYLKQIMVDNDNFDGDGGVYIYVILVLFIKTWV